MCATIRYRHLQCSSQIMETIVTDKTAINLLKEKKKDERQAKRLAQYKGNPSYIKQDNHRLCAIHASSQT